jgi:hypothetical protein
MRGAPESILPALSRFGDPSFAEEAQFSRMAEIFASSDHVLGSGAALACKLRCARVTD